MANSTIEAYTAGSALVGTEIFEGVISPFGAGDDRKYTATQIKTFAVGAGSVAVASGKTLTVSNTITFTATDSSTLAIGTGGTLATAAYKATGTSGNTVPLLDGVNTWSGAQTFDGAIVTAVGAANAPVFKSTDADSGLYWTNNKTLSYSTDSVERFRLGANGDLNILSTLQLGAIAAPDAALYAPGAGKVQLRTVAGGACLLNLISYAASPPAAPAAANAFLYADTSGGKIRIMAIFPSGAAQQIAIEP